MRLKMLPAQRAEYEAIQRQERRERALYRLRSMSSAATAALTDGMPISFEPRRPIDFRRRPKRKSKWSR